MKKLNKVFFGLGSVAAVVAPVAAVVACDDKDETKKPATAGNQNGQSAGCADQQAAGSNTHA